MQVGDIVSAPWGRYVVHRVVGTVVLRSLEREGAYIIAPDESYVPTGEKLTTTARAVLVGSGPVPIQTDPVNGCEIGGVGRPDRNESSPQHDQVGGCTLPMGSSGGNLLVEDVDASAGDRGRLEIEKKPTSIPARPTLGGMRPGLPYCVVGANLCIMWRPCFTRSRDEHGSRTAEPHCWFLSSNRDQSLFCPACRVGKPMVVMGPRHRIAPIVAAVAAGDRTRVDELVVAFFASPLSVSSSSVATVEHPASAIPPAGDLVGDGGRPPDVDTSADRSTAPVAVVAKEVTSPGVISPLPSGLRTDDPKAEVGDFGWKQAFVPRDHADWREFYTERAAIFEYLGGIPRPLAEAKARDLAGREPKAA